MQFDLQKNAGLDARLRKGLAVSIGLHVLLLLFLVLNPDLLSTSQPRVVRLTGEDFERDRFEVLELYVPPELAPPQIAEVLPPAASPPAPVPPPAPGVVEPAPPPPEPAAPESEPPPPEPAPDLPPAPPPAIIMPDDVIAEGARPDAPENAPDPVEAAELMPPDVPGGDDGDGGEPGDGLDGDGAGAEAEAEGVARERALAPERERPVDVADNINPDSLRLPSLRSQAESIIDQVIQQGQRAGSRGSGDRSGESPNLTTELPAILSDTRGYDFGPYMNQVINRVRTNWYSLIPESARIGTERGRVVIVFTITESGRIEGLRAPLNSGVAALDRAAAAAIQASNPFPRLPADFEGDHLSLQFTFLYNIAPEDR